MRITAIFLLIVALVYFPCKQINAQNVGVNTTTPQAALDVNGDVIMRSADLTVSDGITLSLDVNTTRFSNYRVTGPTADFTIAGIAAGIDGRLITLFNRSGFAMQLNNEDANTAVCDMIVTGTGADMIIPNKGVVNLQYDGIEQKWIIKSSNKGGGNITGGYWDTDGTNIYNNNPGNIGMGTSTPSSTSRLDIQTPLNYSGWTHTGGSTIIVDEAIGGVSASLGTKSNHTFRLKTNDQGRFHILEDGRVIISPNNYQPFGQFTVHTLTSGYGISHTDGNVVISTYAGGIPARGYIGTQSNHPLSFYTNGSASQVILLQDGTFGIGTTTPVEKLTVQTLNNTNGISHRGEGGNILSTRMGGTSAGIGTFSNTNMRLFCNSSSAMIIAASNLNIGIGTDNPTDKLTVNGTVKSKEVVVETGWADYVFDKTYKLRPLNEVEKFIKEKNHLPNIPSAKEIEANGLHVGDVQKRMMEKIEELTLYVIELKKEIEKLKSNKQD